jgi:hypothetical protein
MTTNTPGNYDDDTAGLGPTGGTFGRPGGVGGETLPPVRPAEPLTEPVTYEPEQSKSETAKQEAREVGREGAAAGQHVAETAKTEAKQVAREAKEQARSLMSQLSDGVSSQAGEQQQKVASGLRSIGDELASMARNSEQSGNATQLVSQASDKARSVADWLENRDPGSLLDEVKRFARQRPGAFLAIAAGAGMVAGRLTRGLTADSGTDGAASHRAGTTDYDVQSARGFAAPGARTGSAYGGAPGYPETIGYPTATPTGATDRYDTSGSVGGAAGSPETIRYPETDTDLGQGTAIPERDPFEGGGSR